MRIIGNKMGWKIVERESKKEQMHPTPVHCDINVAILLQLCDNIVAIILSYTSKYQLFHQE